MNIGLMLKQLWYRHRTHIIKALDDLDGKLRLAARVELKRDAFTERVHERDRMILRLLGEIFKQAVRPTTARGLGGQDESLAQDARVVLGRALGAAVRIGARLAFHPHHRDTISYEQD